MIPWELVGSALGWTLAVPAVASALLVLVNALVWPRILPGGLHEGTAGAAAGEVSVLIPARDEEARLPGCLEQCSLQGPLVGEILVFDDGSTDATAEVVRSWAARDPRIRLISGDGELPEGWCGKPHALERLAERAQGKWLLFLDADTRLRPGALPALTAEAERRGADLLSPWPGIDQGGRAEKILMPMLAFVVLTLYPTFLQFRRRDPAVGLAHGACLLARAWPYRAMGGHGAVRGEIFEDTALARSMRAAGARTLCLDGQEVVRVRMYESLGEIWEGFRKNFYPAFRREVSFWAFLAFHGAVFLLPWIGLGVAALVGAPLAPWWTAVGAALFARVILALRFGDSLAAAALHPLAEGVLLALGLASWWSVRRGGGVRWKGRSYRASRRDPSGPAPSTTPSAEEAP